MTATAPHPTGPADPRPRVARLNRVSSRRPVEPDTHLPWGTLGPGQVIPDELLSIEGLVVDGRPVALSGEQRARLSREEVAAMLTMGVHFEAVLTVRVRPPGRRGRPTSPIPGSRTCSTRSARRPATPGRSSA